jgi:2-desacetyl-2-hydroxyethyl bacteriochlorophyllide A dehydrogenase
VIIPYQHCGVCGACRQGKTNCCTQLKVLGVHMDGGLQDLIVVPAQALVRAEGLSLDQMAMVENQAIGAHAVRRAQLQPGETVLVVGAGPIGFGAAQFARLGGADVLVTDVSEARLALARRWLAPRQALIAGPELVTALADLTHGDLPAVVFDCTGSAAAMMQSFHYVGSGGRLVLVGLAQADITFHDPDFHRRELTVLSSRNATRLDFQQVIAGMAAGEVVTEPLTTRHVTLEELPAVFPTWLDPQAGVLKATVEL